MLQWAFTGEAIAISAVDGDLVGLEAEASHLLRALGLLVMLVAMFAGIYARRATSATTVMQYRPMLAAILLANLFILVRFAFPDPAGGQLEAVYSAIGSLILSVSILVGGVSGYLTITITLFFILGIALHPVVASPIDEFFESNIAPQELRDSSKILMLSASGTIFATIFATMLGKVSEWRNTQLKKESVQLTELVAAAAAFSVSIATISLFIPEIFSALHPEEAEIPRTIFAIFLIFLVQLPLANGIFDWLSIGATRYLLRRGAESGPGLAIFMAVLDLVIGALIFIALACTTLFFTTFAKNETGVFYLELGPLFTEIALSPEKYWWLYATFFSTILPTLFHAFAASTAIYDGALSVVAPRALASLEKADAQQLRSEARWGVRLLAGAQTAGLVSAVFLTWTLLWALTAGGASSVAAMVFDLLIYWSKLIGALPWDWVKPASAAL